MQMLVNVVAGQNPPLYAMRLRMRNTSMYHLYYSGVSIWLVSSSKELPGSITFSQHGLKGHGSNINIFAERKLRRYISVNTARLRYEERRWEKKQKRRNTFSSFNFFSNDNRYCCTTYYELGLTYLLGSVIKEL